jgi:hypothetical protein
MYDDLKYCIFYCIPNFPPKIFVRPRYVSDKTVFAHKQQPNEGRKDGGTGHCVLLVDIRATRSLMHVKAHEIQRVNEILDVQYTSKLTRRKVEYHKSNTCQSSNAMSCSAIFSSFVWLLFVRKYGFIRNISRAYTNLRRKVWNAIKNAIF